MTKTKKPKQKIGKKIRNVKNKSKDEWDEDFDTDIEKMNLNNSPNDNIDDLQLDDLGSLNSPTLREDLIRGNMKRIKNQIKPNLIKNKNRIDKGKKKVRKK